MWLSLRIIRMAWRAACFYRVARMIRNHGGWASSLPLSLRSDASKWTDVETESADARVYRSRRRAGRARARTKCPSNLRCFTCVWVCALRVRLLSLPWCVFQLVCHYAPGSEMSDRSSSGRVASAERIMHKAQHIDIRCRRDTVV